MHLLCGGGGFVFLNDIHLGIPHEEAKLSL